MGIPSISTSCFSTVTPILSGRSSRHPSFVHTDFLRDGRCCLSSGRVELCARANSRRIDAVSRSGLALPLPQLLEDPALLEVLGRPLGGFDSRGGIVLLSFWQLVARLGIGLVPLAVLYTAAPAVYAHVTSFPALRPSALL